MTMEKAREARRLRSEGMKVGDIAKILEVKPATVSDVVTGRTWKEEK
jgi:predicted transcriptional regulator